MRTILLSCSVLIGLASAASADSYARPLGMAPEAGDVGHVFMAGCAPALPALMEGNFDLFETAFGYATRDTDKDAAYASEDNAVTITFDSSWRGSVCEMTVVPDLAGDGFAIYEDLVAHLEEEIDALPEAEAIDGGLSWTWAREGAADITYTVEFIETPEGHILRTTASQF